MTAFFGVSSFHFKNHICHCQVEACRLNRSRRNRINEKKCQNPIVRGLPHKPKEHMGQYKVGAKQDQVNP